MEQVLDFYFFFRIQIAIGILDGLVRQASLQCGLIFIYLETLKGNRKQRYDAEPTVHMSLPLTYSLLGKEAFPSLTALSEKAPRSCVPVSSVYSKKNKTVGHCLPLFVCFIYCLSSPRERLLCEGGALVYTSGSVTRMSIRISRKKL